MKRIVPILQFLYPAILGLVIYFTVRLITDSASLENHFSEDWRIWSSEMAFFTITGYIYAFVIRWFNQGKNIATSNYNIKTIGQEFLLFCLCILLISNAFLVTGAAFTHDGLDWHDFVVLNLLPLFYCFIVFLILRANVFLKAYINNQIQLERLARDKAEEEIKFLKGQYQPHFLFNALNTIYFQMDESIAGAKLSIEKLSGLLRYRLYEEDSDTVLLSDELGYLKNYIEFQSIRSSEKLKITTDLQTPGNKEAIFPFLLLPFVENAFKHVSGEMWIAIRLEIQDSKLLYTVSNSIDSKIYRAFSKEGIGLKNLEKRLNLLYKDKFQFDIERSEKEYTARLQLTVDSFQK